MKVRPFLNITIAILTILPLSILACTKQQETEMPPLERPPAPEIIEISCDEFEAEKNITQEIEIFHPSSQIVILCSNPTTGYQWTEPAQISDEAVIYQYEHNFVPPEDEDIVGAPGKDVWTLKTLKPGTSTVNFGYSRPWEGGENDAWTLTLFIVVK